MSQPVFKTKREALDTAKGMIDSSRRRENPASDWSWLSFLLGLSGGAALAAFAIKQQSSSTSTSMTTTNP